VPQATQLPSSRGVTRSRQVGHQARSSAGSTFVTRTSLSWLARRARSATRLTASSSSRSAGLVSLAARSLRTNVASWRRASSPTCHRRLTASCTSPVPHGPETASTIAAMVSPTGPAARSACRMCSRIVTGCSLTLTLPVRRSGGRRPPSSRRSSAARGRAPFARGRRARSARPRARPWGSGSLLARATGCGGRWSFLRAPAGRGGRTRSHVVDPRHRRRLGSLASRPRSPIAAGARAR
jgi:hypothetical protein